jgi:hypothetical protein
MIRRPRAEVLKQGVLAKAVEDAALLSGRQGRMIVMVDADDDDPVELANELRRRAKEARPDRVIGVVVPVREYESWFLATAETFAGKFDFPSDMQAPANHQQIRNAKGWLSDQRRRAVRGGAYKETVDQKLMTERLDIDLARERSLSFARAYDAILEVLTAPDPD